MPRALLNDPTLLVVDEPTAGLDPEERIRVRDVLSDLATDRVVILSTHIVSDVEAIAEDIAILGRGRLCRRGTPADLLRGVRGQVWEMLVRSGALPEFRQRHLVSRAVRTPDGTRVRLLAPSSPSLDAAYALLQVGDYRGIYNSQYVGTALALTSGVWLAFAGFYVVKDTVSRDESTGEGQILAATPLSSRAYLSGKLLSNFLVLAAMTGAIALMAVVMLLIRAESADFDLVGLWLPFVLFTLPVMAAVAGLALLFETARGLRGTLGNVVWAAGYFVLYVVSQVLYHLVPGIRVDPLGMAAASRAMRADVLAAHPGATDPAILVAVVTGRTAPERFLWTSGLQIDGTVVLDRIGVILLGGGRAPGRCMVRALRPDAQGQRRAVSTGRRRRAA